MSGRTILEAYQSVYEQQIGVPLDAPTDTAAAKKLREILPASEKDKVVIPKSGLQKADYGYEDLYDEVLDYLISEGCTEEESNYIMTYLVEQGMPPQEIIGRGIANLLGFDKPHPTEVFARGLQKMLYPNKPQTVKAPKPTTKPNITSRTSVKPPATKPNPYRPGATVRATGPNMDKFPELQRFANQGRKIAEPVAKTAAAVSALRNVTPAGAAVAVMAPRPTGDATLTGALKRGDYRPKQGPKGSDEGLTRAQSFDKAYKAAKEKSGMGSNFTWRGKLYKVA